MFRCYFFTMKHVILFSYILISSTGFASLAGLAVLAARLTHPFVKRMLIVQSLFILNLALVACYYYVKQVMDLVGPSDSLELGFGIAANLLNTALYAAIISLLSLRFLLVHQKKLCMAAIAFCSLTIVLQLVHIILAVVGVGSLTGSIAWIVLTYMVIACAMALTGLVLYTGRKRIEHPALQTVVAGTGLTCLLFVPLSFIEYILEVYSLVSYQPLSLEYLLYLMLNIIILRGAAKVLIKQPQNGAALGELSPETAQRFLLTAREQEMATLIAQGLTNKEIAYRLGISEATVRTHIYNLFQKVGVQSRIELLNVLHQ